MSDRFDSIRLLAGTAIVLALGIAAPAAATSVVEATAPAPERASTTLSDERLRQHVAIQHEIDERVTRDADELRRNALERARRRHSIAERRVVPAARAH